MQVMCQSELVKKYTFYQIDNDMYKLRDCENIITDSIIEATITCAKRSSCAALAQYEDRLFVMCDSITSVSTSQRRRPPMKLWSRWKVELTQPYLKATTEAAEATTEETTITINEQTSTLVMTAGIKGEASNNVRPLP